MKKFSGVLVSVLMLAAVACGVEEDSPQAVIYECNVNFVCDGIDGDIDQSLCINVGHSREEIDAEAQQCANELTSTGCASASCAYNCTSTTQACE